MSRVNDETISKVLLTIDKYRGNVTNFKKAVMEGQYTSTQQPRLFSRLLLWKTCLITDSFQISSWSSKLNDSRIVFHQLIKRDDMRIPWYKLDADCFYHQSLAITRKSSLNRRQTIRGMRPSLKMKTERVETKEDPLRTRSSGSHSSCLSKSSSDTADDLELLESIILDIERLFPGEEFFHNTNDPNTILIKRQLIEILFVWSKCNQTVGYKQGLHEILGLIYWNLYKESVNYDPKASTFTNEEASILNLFNKNYLCHDIFTIFNKFVLSSGIITRFYESETCLTNSINQFDMYLMKIDQFIHYTMNTRLHLESQLWIIRYLRLVLIRELGNDLEVTNLVWDKLIASQPDSKGNTSSGSEKFSCIVDLIYFIVIVLLIQRKTDIISADFSDCLSLLLHYPMPKFTTAAFRDTFVKQLYHDALKLYQKRNDDLKLYEYGNKLNKKYNGNLKILMSYRNSEELGDPNSARSSIESINQQQQQQQQKQKQKTPLMDATQDRAEKMRFEKMSMEMRLKKKVQSMIKP
ncbi:hypothetical protein KGF56_001976 [Candida oxycetoniae]|uniref:Oxidant-induced cell-cycle arrest protein 5 n=1 Tax=Candida oxycetoniae TaxID=497107 RepID=A0AAI9SYC8_9ASCO|nr:uncharacterized protein KGF56_001976 [Candida oxycetoniae]KAI3405231.2 hypothetical protein KGF56_001976 [Candida oxycetoniae]